MVTVGSVVDQTPHDFLHQVTSAFSQMDEAHNHDLKVVENEDGMVVYAGGPLALVMDTFCAAHNLSYQIKPSPGKK